MRLDTKRQQFNTENLFNVIMRNQLTPKSDECLFILTDSDLYPQDNWTFVFGVTRPNLRTLVQSIARHDAKFPEVSAFRAAQAFFRKSHTLDERRPSNNRMHEVAEGGNFIAETSYHNKYLFGPTGIRDSAGSRSKLGSHNKAGLFRSSSLRQTASDDRLTDKPPGTTTQMMDEHNQGLS